MTWQIWRWLYLGQFWTPIIPWVFPKFNMSKGTVGQFAGGSTKSGEDCIFWWWRLYFSKPLRLVVKISWRRFGFSPISGQKWVGLMEFKSNFSRDIFLHIGNDREWYYCWFSMHFRVIFFKTILGHMVKWVFWQSKPLSKLKIFTNVGLYREFNR